MLMMVQFSEEGLQVDAVGIGERCDNAAVGHRDVVGPHRAVGVDAVAGAGIDSGGIDDGVVGIGQIDARAAARDVDGDVVDGAVVESVEFDAIGEVGNADVGDGGVKRRGVDAGAVGGVVANNGESVAV